MIVCSVYRCHTRLSFSFLKCGETQPPAQIAEHFTCRSFAAFRIPKRRHNWSGFEQIEIELIAYVQSVNCHHSIVVKNMSLEAVSLSLRIMHAKQYILYKINRMCQGFFMQYLLQKKGVWGSLPFLRNSPHSYCQNCHVIQYDFFLPVLTSLVQKRASNQNWVNQNTIVGFGIKRFSLGWWSSKCKSQDLWWPCFTVRRKVLVKENKKSSWKQGKTQTIESPKCFKCFFPLVFVAQPHPFLMLPTF